MKMTSFRVILAVILTVPALGAQASGWTEPVTIASAFVEDSDYLIVYTKESRQYAANCDGKSWHIYAANDARRSRIWATVLTAAATGKKIQFWYTDNCGVWGYQSATAVKIVAE